MLDEYRQIYEQEANKIPGWKTENKNILCNAYINASDDLKESYLSAIICRYWNNIDKLHRNSAGQFSIEDCYELFIESILYILNHKRWLDEDNSLYNDPTAPDKMINVSLRTIRLTKFQALNKDKRKLNMNLQSMDSLQEELGDVYQVNLVDDQVVDFVSKDFVNSIIRDEFRKKEYFNAIIIFNIVYDDTFDDESNLNYNKLYKKVMKNDEDMIHLFCRYINVEEKEVKEAVMMCKSICSYLSRAEFEVIVRKIMKIIRNQYYLKEE